MITHLSDGRKALRLQVIEVAQKIGTFYIGSVDAKELIEISYSDVRRLASEQRDVERYLGIQRPVSAKRIKDIRRYLESPDASFPTAIILAVDERCAELDPQSGTLTLSEYFGVDGFDEDISFEKVAKVLDGQHRLAGFLDDNDNYQFDFDQKFELNVSIFIGADLAEQASIFSTVNLAQTKVNKSLVYDLEDFSRARNPYKTCHKVAVALDDLEGGPFENRIKRLGVTTPGRTDETITQASFVESLVKFISKDPLTDRNSLMDGRRLKEPSEDELQFTPFRRFFFQELDIEIALVVNNYFLAIRNRWPQSWAEPRRKGNLLPKSNAFKAFMKFLKDDVYVKVCNGDYLYVPSPEEFAPYFHSVDLSDDDFNTRNFAPGSGGQSMFLKVLRGEVEGKSLFEE